MIPPRGYDEQCDYTLLYRPDYFISCILVRQGDKLLRSLASPLLAPDARAAHIGGISATSSFCPLSRISRDALPHNRDLARETPVPSLVLGCRRSVSKEVGVAVK